MSGGTEAAGIGAGAEDTSQWRYTTLFALSIGSLALSAMLGPVAVFLSTSVTWMMADAHAPYFGGRAGTTAASMPWGSGSTHEAVGFAWGVVGVAAAAHVAAWWRWYNGSSGGGDGGGDGGGTGFTNTTTRSGTSVRRTGNVGGGSKSRHYSESSGPGGGGGGGGGGGTKGKAGAITEARAGAGGGGGGAGERERHGLRQQQQPASSSESTLASGGGGSGGESGMVEPIADADFAPCLSLVQDLDLIGRPASSSVCPAVERPGDAPWENIVDNKTVSNISISCWRQKHPTGVYTYRTVGKAPFPAKRWIQVMNDLEYRKTWDAYATDLDVVETLPDGTDLVYWQVKYPFFLSNRDYLYRRKTKQFTVPVTGRRAESAGSASAPLTYACVGDIPRSLVESPPVQYVAKAKPVRVDTYLGHALVQADPEDPHSCRFGLIALDDPKLNIPKSLLNWAVSKAVPASMKMIHDACANYPT